LFKFSFLFSLIFFSLSCFAGNRMEDLFLWKISEELKLTVKEEKELTKLIQELNQKKTKISRNMDLLVANSKSTHLEKYRNLLTEYNQISVLELDGVKKILGPEKTMKYFFVKNELSQKIKVMLSGGSEKGKKNLPEPKVIEEK